MILHEIILKENKQCIKLSGWFEDLKGQKKEIFFEYPTKFKEFINPTADAFLPVLLIPCMMSGENLHIIPSLSTRMYQSTEYVQDIFTNWFSSKFQKINITAETLHSHGLITEKSAQFFSLGVDSFYTLLKNHDKNIRYLIYMQGLELPLYRYKTKQEEGVVKGISKIEEHYNVELIHGKTNMRDVFELDWPKYYHGAGLAGTALSLSRGFDNVFIASSHSYGCHIPIGSSFMLDHYWSTEHLQVIHDGAEKGRSYKLSDLVIADSFALNRLRVCTENDGGDFNCCKCRKCISTMLTLEILGVLDTCTAFPIKYLKGQIYKISPKNLSSYALAKDLYSLALKYNRLDLAKEIETELLMGRHDLYGRLELSISLKEYIADFVKYLWLKIKRGS